MDITTIPIGKIVCLICGKTIKITHLSGDTLFTICENCQHPSDWQNYNWRDHVFFRNHRSDSHSNSNL